MNATVKECCIRVEKDISILISQTGKDSSEEKAAEQLESDVRMLKGLLELQHIKFDKTGDVFEILKAARRKPCRTNA